MPNGQLSGVLCSLRLRAAPRDAPGVSDAELLERYERTHDEAAFELLVWRHSRMVLGVCRRILRDEHAVEDAFQAAFLALARRAGSIRRRQSVGGWLYRVAYRVALDSRARAARQAMREVTLVETATAERGPDAEAVGRELLQAIEAELDRLPEKYRLPLIRSCAGETSSAIARDLGCPPGTVESWLTRARQRLRAGLLRRGVAAPAGMLAAVLAVRRAPACVPARLVVLTVRTVAPGCGAGTIPPQVTALAEGGLRTMRSTRWQMAAALVLVTGALGVGAALLAPGVPVEQRVVADQPRPAETKPAREKPVGPGRIYVHVNFPPTLIDYLAQRDLNARLVAIDPDTGTWDKINDNGGFPRLSPDGNTLLFTRQLDQVWSCDVRGKEEPRQLSDKGGHPRWSADGKRFVTTRGKLTPADAWQTETWQVNADGSGATQLAVPDTDFVDDWSRDGQWFVTSSDRHPPKGRGYQLYLMHPDGTGQRRLTRGAGLNCASRFSPDGQLLVYLHQERGINSLHVAAIHMSSDWEILKEKDGVAPESCSWSPDSRRLVVVFLKRPPAGARDLLGNPIRETWRMETMDVDGGNRRELKLRNAKGEPQVPLGIGDPDWR
jgi:RNA polymerase sigma factor (sigma-70 family)